MQGSKAAWMVVRHPVWSARFARFLYSEVKGMTLPDKSNRLNEISDDIRALTNELRAQRGDV